MHDPSSRQESVIFEEKVLAFHKLFYVDFKENQRGRFLKITEKDGRFRSTIIVPEEAIEDLSHALSRIVDRYVRGSRMKQAPEDAPTETSFPR